MITLAVICLLFGMTSGNNSPAVQKFDSADTVKPMENKMKITVGSKSYMVTLEDNPTVVKLKELLPMTLDMKELNGNEKYYHLSTRLPTDEISPGKIQVGDLMLYGNNSLVIFYEALDTTYTYTPLGRIDDPSGLVAAVGKGSVKVSFELE